MMRDREINCPGWEAWNGACEKKSIYFFFNDTATTEIYTLSLHDALPIYFNETAVLEFVKYELEKPKYDVEECQQRDMTYSEIGRAHV